MHPLPLLLPHPKLLSSVLILLYSGNSEPHTYISSAGKDPPLHYLTNSYPCSRSLPKYEYLEKLFLKSHSTICRPPPFLDILYFRFFSFLASQLLALLACILVCVQLFVQCPPSSLNYMLYDGRNKQDFINILFLIVNI